MLQKVFSLLFPPTENEQIIFSTTFLTPQPLIVKTPNGSPVLTCALYNDPAIQASIKTLKKHGTKKAAFLLAQLLNDTILEELSDIETWNSKHVVLIPMPLSKRRMRERGFNQITKVCSQLPDELRQCVMTDILVQTKHVPMQKTLTREKRLENVSGIFSISHPEKIRSAHAIIIDDVMTTGATFSEAIDTFNKHGIPVTAVALARA